ncbi:MAG: homoserine kinase [Myxococcales bacterium]|nr:homoserine kinase [Myxococcales bacterium]
MAVLTPIHAEDGSRILTAHGLGALSEVIPVPEGSVNTNYILVAGPRRVFLRVYEEQGPDGAEYEWALLERLRAAGVPVPIRIEGPPAGAIQVAGKPVALFELITGEECCQARVTAPKAAAVGRALAEVHGILDTVPECREGRFTLAHVVGRLDRTEATLERDGGLDGPEVRSDIARLRALHAELADATPPGLDRGIIHGDLSRDNVRWEGDRISVILDWESAAEGARVYDLVVTMLAWCFGDTLDLALASAMARAYHAARPLDMANRTALHWAARTTCLRFASTRLTDYYLRRGKVQMQYRDYRRFLARLDAVEAYTPEQFADALGV